MTYNLCAWDVAPSLLRHTPGIHVRIGMVTSLNGFICYNGTSRGIGGAADYAALCTLRRHADAVINTATTVLAENLSPANTRLHVILTATDKLCTTMPIFEEGVDRVLIIAGSNVSPDSIEKWRVAGARVHQVAQEYADVRWLIEWLRDDHDIKTVVCEGGPMLNAQMSDAGLVDEWCITVAGKLLVASDQETEGPNRIVGPLASPVTLNLRHLLATAHEMVGIYSTHCTGGRAPLVSTA